MDPTTSDPGPRTDWSALLERLDRIDRRLDALGAPASPPKDEGNGPAPPIRRRWFTLLDLMILVACTAIALPAYRVVPGVVATTGFSSTSGLRRLIVAILIGWGYATPIAAALSLAVVVLRLVGPRTERRSLDRQPGVLSSAVVVPLLLTVTPIYYLLYQVLGPIALNDVLFFAMVSSPRVAGPAVAGVWAALWAAGRFDRTADWVDGLGRVLGLYWLIAGAFNIPVV